MDKKTFDHLKIVRQVARELAMTRQETDAWIEACERATEKEAKGEKS